MIDYNCDAIDKFFKNNNIVNIDIIFNNDSLTIKLFHIRDKTFARVDFIKTIFFVSNNNTIDDNNRVNDNFDNNVFNVDLVVDNYFIIEIRAIKKSSFAKNKFSR